VDSCQNGRNRVGVLGFGNTVWNSGGRGWEGVVVVMRLSSGIRKAGRWVCAETAETEQVCLVSGTPCEAAGGGGEKGWCGGDGGGGAAVRWHAQGQGGGFVPKQPKPSGCARFRARRVKRQWERVGRGLSGGMRKARGVGLCQNSQNRAGVLGFGHAV